MRRGASHDSCRCSPGRRSFLTLQRGNACRDALRHKSAPRCQFRSAIKKPAFLRVFSMRNQLS
ncbi:DUF1534 domain-containing protein [Pseudomonas amygdali pv. tabaci str. ATCC 11528]|nr:DUF1534 domain-containing protein [Pseudomonas amygdali pv. tabaci str. ATCC 11528]